MTVAITGSAMLTCFGDADATFGALLAGRCGVAPLRYGDPAKLNVGFGYGIDVDAPEGDLLASTWLADVVARALDQAKVDPATQRVAVVVGTGLRELRSLERWNGDGAAFELAQLHFGAAVRAVAPDVTEVHTLANACSATGYALALGTDLLAMDEADAVVVAGTDAMTESMLAMIGRISERTASRVQPFDTDREGVLLGEGAAAVVLQPVGARPALGLLRGVGLTCDAYHETAPDQAGIVAAVRDAHQRAGLAPEQIGMVVAHGTATALNDPTEAAALIEAFGPNGPPVTAIKGAIGHTSGGAALMSLQVALAAMREHRVPPVVGLRNPIAQAQKLAMVIGPAQPTEARIAQVNSFGFGGVNAVTIVEVGDEH